MDLNICSMHNNRDANHPDFCGIVPIFTSDFRIMISDIKIQANNDFNRVPDKIKGVSPSATLIKLITGSKIKY